MSASKDLVKILKESEKKGTEPYDTEATVKRIDGSTAWVHIPGGVEETPVQLTIGSRVGDKVQVRVSGGRAWLVGNSTAPPTDDSTAITINKQTNRYVKTVEAKVDTVSKIAGDTDQYFWHTETGTDTGAHITEIPRERFLADPDNGGGNLLARSNGIVVRDGLTELATFGANGTTIYQDGNAVAVIGKGTYDGNGRIGLGSLLTSAGENRVSIYDRSLLNASTGRFRTVYKDTTMSSSTMGYVEVGATSSGGSVRLSAEGAGSESGSLHLYASPLYPKGRLDIFAEDVEMYLNTTSASGTDHDLYAAITALGWESEVIV